MKIEKRFFEICRRYKLTAATAESCTGGLVAAKIINISGVSEYYPGGVVTYSNSAKTKFAGVKKITLAMNTAVSPQTCAEMARGASRTFGTRVGISTTGEAGPQGSIPGKPVGLVYVGCCVDGLVYVKKCFFEGDRNAIREKAAAEALVFACKCIYHVRETMMTEDTV